jgi:hypothetical protein
MKKKKGFTDSNAYAVARNMPPSRHKLPGCEFAWSTSAVIEWLTSRPEIQSYLFSKVRQSGAIIYDPETGTWSGRDYDDPG